MDQKLLMESGWKTCALKFKIQDNGLQKALAAYEDLDEAEHDERLKCLDAVNRLTAELKKLKEVAAQKDVSKYLAGVAAAADAQKAEVTKAKTIKIHLAQKKAEDAAKERNGADEADQEEGDFAARLLAAFQKLKGAKDASYEFIICEAKPLGIMLAKKITAQHKAELTKLTGGTKFHPMGRCSFRDGKFNFSLEKPISGLAGKLQEAIKIHTGKKLAIVCGGESLGEEEEGAPAGQAAQAQSGVAAKPGPAGEAVKMGRISLDKASELWHQTRKTVEGHVDQLKKAIRSAFADEGPDLITEIEGNMKRLDWVLDTLDRKLGDSMSKAYAANNPNDRQIELKNSKAILANYIKYVKTEPIIAHIDSNPFGVNTNLKGLLATRLTQMAEAVS